MERANREIAMSNGEVISFTTVVGYQAANEPPVFPVHTVCIPDGCNEIVWQLKGVPQDDHVNLVVQLPEGFPWSTQRVDSSQVKATPNEPKDSATEGFVLRSQLWLRKDGQDGRAATHYIAIPTKTQDGTNAIVITVKNDGTVDKERIALLPGTNVEWDFGGVDKPHSILFTGPLPLAEGERNGPFQDIQGNNSEDDTLQAMATGSQYKKYTYLAHNQPGGGLFTFLSQKSRIVIDPEIDYLPPPPPPGSGEGKRPPHYGRRVR
jgi:hypothetical protein